MASKREKELLKLLAEAYAFILDTRRVAINLVSPIFIKKTEGIEEKVESIRLRYPRTFSQYFNKASRKAKGERDGEKAVKVLQAKEGGDKREALYQEKSEEGEAKGDG